MLRRSFRNSHLGLLYLSIIFNNLEIQNDFILRRVVGSVLVIIVAFLLPTFFSPSRFYQNFQAEKHSNNIMY